MSEQAIFRRTMLAWYRGHRRSFPWRESRDPYTVLIGEVLLQRTRGENAVHVFESFVERWPTPSDLAKARTSSIASVIRPLGLAKRAPLLKDLGKALHERGCVPDDPEELLALPGVGPYAAHAVPVFTQDRKLPVVDWVIARVLRRYFGLPDDRRPNADPDLWNFASDLVRPGKPRELWLGTLDFAAGVCKPRPLCPTCPVASTCAFAISQRAESRITPL